MTCVCWVRSQVVVTDTGTGIVGMKANSQWETPQLWHVCIKQQNLTDTLSCAGRRTALSVQGARTWVFFFTVMSGEKKMHLGQRGDSFVEYNKNRPAQLILSPDSGNVQKHRLVKPVERLDADGFELQDRSNRTEKNMDVMRVQSTVQAQVQWLCQR